MESVSWAVATAFADVVPVGASEELDWFANASFKSTAESKGRWLHGCLGIGCFLRRP